MSVASSANGIGDESLQDKLRQDIGYCEMCISQAARAGVAIPELRIRAVKLARAQLHAGAVDPETEAAFYTAMAHIVAHAPYPNAKVAADLRCCAEVVSHAGITGKALATSDLSALAAARNAQKEFDWSPAVEVPFYDAMTRMTESIAPVSGDTVGAEARKGARKAIRKYSILAALLTLLVLVLSCLLFAIKQISEDVEQRIKESDPMALTMHNELQAYSSALSKANDEVNQRRSEEVLEQVQNSPEAVVIKETLQKFAANNRQLYSDIERTRTISRLFFWLPNEVGQHLYALFGKPWGEYWGIVSSRYTQNCKLVEITSVPEPNFAFSNGMTYGFRLVWPTQPLGADWECSSNSLRHALEIDLPLFDIGTASDQKIHQIPKDTVNQGFQKIALYQQIRATANYARDNILTFVGMTTGFVLPILYAWLGATAAILRKLRDDTAACLFHPEYSKVANRAHVTTAVIVGISIGLFSDLLQEGKSISPLAVAFVAGYASDRFFQFIDRLVHALFPSNRELPEPPPEPKRERPASAGETPLPAQT
ncbi:hypothetical protein LJ656_25265 [Paraburkholderia sp. MMS20-SJTR3]|uniref:Uncharacterized protein n=1 Tax=Paraburkholderia sejongensis TaxID=2886946 RepID=A0ABS8K164_9BURK|nr:hypothetical protein [Paraburkholderia sp. MMS20-SJTR3]MCC8395900.1 hypothetical protein [Paraburkholderia sp. MMS20-SJTR3]